MDERQGLLSASLEERVAAAESLSMMGEDAAPAAVELVRACGDDEEVRQWAVAALEEMGAPPESAIAALTELVADQDPTIAYWAITLLGRSGDRATGSQDALAKALGRQSDPAVAERAAWAFARIKPTADSACAALEQAAQSEEPRLARLAKDALGQPQV